MSMTLAPTNATPLTLRCPKCAGEMVTYERSGIHVDQCRECRGIFLDRGELERLVDAESNGAGWTGPTMVSPAPVPLPRTREPREPRDPRTDGRHDPRYDRRHDRPDGYRPGGWSSDEDDDDDDRGRRSDDDWGDRDRRDARSEIPRKRRSILSDLLEGLGE